MTESPIDNKVVKRGITWFPVENDTKKTRIGGKPFLISNKKTSEVLDSYPPAYISRDDGDTILLAWPHFEGEPLPFFGQFVWPNGDIAYLFLDDKKEGSWQAENGANAVVIYPEDNREDWLEYKRIDAKDMPLYSEQAYSFEDNELFWKNLGKNRDEPLWLQGDETPESYTFKLQIPSQIDPEGKVNIGDGYGDVYIFIAEDEKSGRIVWQS